MSLTTSRIKPIAGTFARLTVLNRDPADSAYVFCTCACGAGSRRYRVDCLRSGNTRSCGCLQRESAATGKSHTTHGRTGTTEYGTWTAMLARCTNPNVTAYKNYGARGITVCDRWRSFENFHADMGPRPEGLTLDRRDNALGYSKDNCHWTTPLHQNRNRRGLVVATYEGVTKPLWQWCEIPGALNNHIVWGRLSRGWPLQLALFAPAHVRLGNAASTTIPDAFRPMLEGEGTNQGLLLKVKELSGVES